jgi:hypothetical protein
LRHLYDISTKIASNILDLKNCHLDVNFKQEKLFDMNKKNSEIYSKYLQGHRGMRSILHMLCEKSEQCENFLTTIDRKEKASFTDICTLFSMDIEKYLEIYQEWKLIHLDDKFGVKLKEIIANFNHFIQENENYIDEIYQQEKFISIQKLLGINDLASASYTGTNRKARTSKFIYDGVLEYSGVSCQVFLFDKLLIISEMELSGRKNILLPVVIGEFSVEPLADSKEDQCRFQIIFNEETVKIFKAKDEKSKGKWIRQLQKVSINKIEGERELITNLIEQSHTIDSPKFYYAEDISKLKKLISKLPDSKEYIEYSEENHNDIKCATFEKLIEILTHPQNYGKSTGSN